MWKLNSPLIFIVASSNPWILGLEDLAYTVIQWTWSGARNVFLEIHFSIYYQSWFSCPNLCKKICNSWVFITAIDYIVKITAHLQGIPATISYSVSFQWLISIFQTLFHFKYHGLTRWCESTYSSENKIWWLWFFLKMLSFSKVNI